MNGTGRQLLGIQLTLFAIVLALISTGAQIVILGVAVVGLLLAFPDSRRRS
jgi:hypothetical protein